MKNNLRYNIGDKVKIRDYEVIEIEMPCIVENRETLNQEIEKFDRIVTIKDIVFSRGYEAYTMEEIDGAWYDALIECSFNKYKKKYYIKSRFDILDL